MVLHESVGRAERIAMEIRRAEAIEESHRSHQRFLAKGFLAWVLCQLAGLFVFGMAINTVDREFGNLCFHLSFLVAYGGGFFTLVGFYVSGRERGVFD
jgi:hypothetical protein